VAGRFQDQDEQGERASPHGCDPADRPGTYRRTKNDVGRIVAALEAKLGRYSGEEDLVNAEEWL
jgi:hypothetical protein